ncbi:K-box domain-containing protein, partial [Cephalotus follicularis]
LHKQDTKELDVLKDENAKLQMKQLRLLGKDLAGLNLKELQQLEQQLNEGLSAVKKKKVRQNLDLPSIYFTRVLHKRDSIGSVIEELRGFFSSTDIPNYFDYRPVERKNSLINYGGASPDVAYDSMIERGDSDTTLHLGPPTDVYHKRKAPERDAHSNDSGS